MPRSLLAAAGRGKHCHRQRWHTLRRFGRQQKTTKRWRAVMTARGKADETELRRQFMAAARSSGLVAEVHALGRHGEEDVRHVFEWGLSGWDPWGGEFSDG
jgi:hypothetical protein